MDSNAMATMNAEFKELGLPELDVVTPSQCVGQEINARYMDQQTMQNLVDNVGRDGRLESTPLVCKRADGKYDIISGHHRIEAAQKAGLEHLIVMITDVGNDDELRMKQLSHNAVEGKDDDVLLKKMYEGIQSLEGKYYSGLQDELDGLSYTSLNFRAGNFEQFIVGFLPDDIQTYDEMISLVEKMTMTPSAVVRLAPRQDFDEFGRAIREIKKIENIKSNGTALLRMVELAKERLDQICEEAPPPT